MSLITVCVPTFRRPDLLAVALRSVLAQDYEPIEIIVGDDSPTDEAESLVEELRAGAPQVSFRYFRNSPSLGQNGNVDRLLRSATGSRLLILHDDDVLCPGALRTLDRAWRSAPNISIAFGKQELIDTEGVVDKAGSIKLNRDYFRSDEYVGVQGSPKASALRQQIPNDGFLIETATAQATGYRSEADVGSYCDLDFNLRAAMRLPPESVVFVDEFTSQYRVSQTSISNDPRSRQSEHPRAAIAIYRLVQGMILDGDENAAKGVLMRRLADKLIKGFALSGMRRAGARVFFSRAYPMRSRLSPRGLYHLALLAVPAIDKIRKY